MKVLYLDCGMGAAGDMLAAALIELLPDRGEFLAKLNALGLPGVSVSLERAERCGIVGSRFVVRVGGEQEGEAPREHSHSHTQSENIATPASVTSPGHSGENEHRCAHTHEECAQQNPGETTPSAGDAQLGVSEKVTSENVTNSHNHAHTHVHVHVHVHASPSRVEEWISSMRAPGEVKEDVREVYRALARAESEVHGQPVEEVHFHEVGALDALTDITAVLWALRLLSPDEVICSPVRVGSGSVACAHGTLPVPAPATTLLLRGIPIYAGELEGEMCTPTGAALLRKSVTSFGEMPPIVPSGVGYGMGKRDFPRANCVRAILGSKWGEGRPDLNCGETIEQICELSCNLDDATPEQISHAAERLFEEGALDVYTTPIGMKKSRPGVLLTALCQDDASERARLRAVFLRETPTLGVRERSFTRYTLARRVETVATPLGEVRVKISSDPALGVVRRKVEYEDLSRAARENNLSLSEAENIVREYIEKI